MVVSNTVYLYRYFLPVLPETEQGYTLATQMVDVEQRMGETRGIQLIGRRYLVRKQRP